MRRHEDRLVRHPGRNTDVSGTVIEAGEFRDSVPCTRQCQRKAIEDKLVEREIDPSNSRRRVEANQGRPENGLDKVGARNSRSTAGIG